MKSFKELSAPSDRALTAIREEAFAALTGEERAKFNVGVAARIYPAGHELQLVDRRLVVRQDAVLVFVDQMPGANYGHPCRYRFHSPHDGQLLQDEAASFPPEVADRDTVLDLFHAPVRTEMRRPIVYRPVNWAKVRPFPWSLDDDNRYALLFTSQISNRRHVEDLEFAWRTLRHRFGFPASHIYVLCYDGAIGATDASAADMATWIGDNTPYEMIVHAAATKQNLQNTLNTIAGKMNGDSLLFVHTNNHGAPSGLCIDQSTVLTPVEWATMLQGMSGFGKLVVTMEQCYSGAFLQPTLNNSRAAKTSFASAVPADKVSAGAWHFDPWAQSWFEGVNGATVYGAGLPGNPDADNNGRISVREAFDYSDSYDTALSSYDDPQYGDSPVGCGNSLYLTRTPTVRDLLRELAARYEAVATALLQRIPLPDPPPIAERELIAALSSVDALTEQLGLEVRLSARTAAPAIAPALEGSRGRAAGRDGAPVGAA